MLVHDDHDSLTVPAELPLLPVRDLVVFPDVIAPLFAHRPLSVAAVERALTGERMLLLVAQRSVTQDEPAADDLYQVGTVGLIVRMRRMPDDRIKLLVQGLRKARVDAFLQERPCFAARISLIHDLPLDQISVETEALMRSLREQLTTYSRLSGQLGPDALAVLQGLTDPGRLADLAASNLPLPVEAAQEVIETPDPVRRLRLVVGHLAHELELTSTKVRIESEVREGMQKTQHDYFLREQMRQIQSELGTDDASEQAEFETRLAGTQMPDPVRAEARKQLGRLGRMHGDSAEANTIRTYLDWLLELPWAEASQDRLDLVAARAVLDEAHLGLDLVKERVLEYLAVRKLNPHEAAPILCLVGPPGVGKTSLGRSIARALERHFVRLGLGGLRDEAEIRGHRRTYVGALPGKIIQAMRQACTVNPVLVLDELDKVGREWRGDPTAALLEVLDPEQNQAFVDHYLNVPYDLSRVLFVATANRTDTIPPALFDRLETIEMPGYSRPQKTVIAERHLAPRQFQRCGLPEGALELGRETLEALIDRYTAEAGLRQLERAIGALARKAARRVAEGEAAGLGRIAPVDLPALLGPAVHRPMEAATQDAVGIACGLAWTPTGGEVLPVEASAMTGRGQLILTGQLGDVMKESAQAALSLVRSWHDRLGLAPAFFAEHDLHLHVPAGAIPKDGPSAGLAMVGALLGLLTGIPTRHEVAVTGEITLRGRLLPVGGLREKLLAAKRAGLSRVVAPEANREDLDHLEPEIRSGLELLLADTVEEAVAWILTRPPFRPARRREPRTRSAQARGA